MTMRGQAVSPCIIQMASAGRPKLRATKPRAQRQAMTASDAWMHSIRVRNEHDASAMSIRTGSVHATLDRPFASTLNKT